MHNYGKYIRNPLLLYRYLSAKGLTKWVSDSIELRLLYRSFFGKWPNLSHPLSFSEKMQWLKLHDRKVLYTTLVDKLAVKDWVVNLIGSSYVTPTYASWDKVEDIDISGLPDSFVLKANHDSGGNAICLSKETFDLKTARQKLSKALARNYFWACREWPYKNVKPRVFAEEYLSLPDGGVIDYKFFCFNGEPRFLYISRGMENHATARMAFLNLDWTRASFRRNDYYEFEELPPRPASYDEMFSIAKILSKGIPFARIDLFEYQGTPRFSEVTFTTCGGFMTLEPSEWDRRLGDLLELPSAAYGDKPCR